MTTFIILTILITLVFLAFIIWGLPYFLDTSIPAPSNNGFGSETVSAQVLQVVDQGTVNLGGVDQTYKDLEVRILEGQYKGAVVQMNYGKDQFQPEGIHYVPGDQILVTIGSRQQECPPTAQCLIFGNAAITLEAAAGSKTARLSGT